MQHISPTTIRAPTNLQIYLKDRLSQVSVQWIYCLFWMMRRTLSIIQLYKPPIRANKTSYCEETTQPLGVPSHPTIEIWVLITMTHHFRYTPRGIMVGALFCSICQIFPVWFHCAMFHPQIIIQTYYITFQHRNLRPHFKITCVKSVLWPTLISNVVGVSLSGGCLCYWTPCNHGKRYCTLPYCTLVWMLNSYVHGLGFNEILCFNALFNIAHK